jgi:hypothetical protein
VFDLWTGLQPTGVTNIEGNLLKRKEPTIIPWGGGEVPRKI